MENPPNPPPKRPSLIGGLASAIVPLSILVLALLYFLGTRRVEPWEVGAKKVKLPILIESRGIVEKAYGPGLHVVIPYVHDFVMFDSTVQKLELSNRPPERGGHGAEQIRFKTADGNDIFVDATVLFRIDDQRPWVIWTNFGAGAYEYVERRVKPSARSIIRTVLGELSTEEFYNSPTRQKKVDECRERMTRDLAGSGLILVDLLIRDFQFTPEIEAAIRKRKLADQLKLVNEAKAQAAQEKARIDQIVATGEAGATVEIGRGDTEAQKIRAEAELYRKTKEAEAQLAMTKAEAESKRMMALALTGSGGPNMVGLDMAKSLEGIELIVLPTGAGGINPLDVQSMLELFQEKGR